MIFYCDDVVKGNKMWTLGKNIVRVDSLLLNIITNII